MKTVPRLRSKDVAGNDRRQGAARTARGMGMLAAVAASVILAAGCSRQEPAASGPRAAEVSALRCMMHAPPHVAKWSEEHPAWRVVRWRCRTLRQQDT